MNGSEILIDGLKREGVDTIFGYPGGVVIPIFDVLYSTKEIKFLLTRHEQGATHAADGYARSTGKVGVCLVTSGPGATNTITGIASAKMDSSPIIVISGQVASGLIGTDAFQETDMVGLTRSICKHNYLVKDVNDLPRVIKEAFHIARTGRPGPVSIDIPVDVANAKLKEYKYPETINLPGYKPAQKGNNGQVKKLVDAIVRAKKPLLYTGGGIISSGATDDLLALIDKTQIPVVVTLMGLGSVPFNHPDFLGMPGMHGRVAANKALMECDLLIGVGVRFDDRITGPKHTFATNAIIAHIDIDPAEIGKNIKADIPIVGDAKAVLQQIIEKTDVRSRDSWNERMNFWKEKFPLSYKNNDDGLVNPQYVIERMNTFVNEDSIMVTDVGQHQMWSALYCHYRHPRKFLSSGGLGTMGFGLPAAMGAAVANPDTQVVCISGDGGIQMNIQELATCAINQIPVKVIVLNNFYLGMVRQWQDLFWDKKYSRVCLQQTPNCPAECRGPNGNCPPQYLPDLVKVAEANGMLGYRAKTKDEVDEVLKKGLAADGPVLMEFFIKREENVFPMVSAGKPLSDMMTGD
ncbi:MAG: biosynthetic-type acetolactate synthase large subunit [Candidatus Marinimicrobia bacterium]|nr:biosynthetic-type acetolactate synthase large subunit [Candidatus Neomarinimicrobiota bacterium]